MRFFFSVFSNIRDLLYLEAEVQNQLATGPVFPLWPVRENPSSSLAFDGFLAALRVSLACSLNISVSDSVFIWCALLVCLSSNNLPSFY